MRLVHLADLHLGYRQYHRLTPAGINQREADVAHAFKGAVDRAIELRPDIIVIAGDIFHTVRPMNPAIIDAFQQFHRLNAELPDAVKIMVAGNHDRPRASETGCILDLFTRVGFQVVIDQPRRFTFPDRELSILAVPDLPGALPPLTPDPDVKHNVLVLHGEVEGMLPPYIAAADRATVEISREALSASSWSYVALGHFHVHREIAPNAFYSGSIDYTSANPWGELVEERDSGLPGKGFIEYDLDAATHHFHHVQPARALVDLEPIAARGLSAAELDALIRERVEGCAGGIDDSVVRLVVRDVPRHIARELDHKALRDYKRRALHFHLDTRRPELLRSSASGAPGRRPTLMETVESYLSRRPMDADLDRGAVVQLGLQYLREADSDAERAAPAVPAVE
ncbi:MAG TPA: metallophosphoesterase [Gemmatimonadaceae bacterium]|nr:metallophosphoesterase [Gemmatimonadaceae bacterium]